MASDTRATQLKRNIRRSNAGRKRKNLMARKSTPSEAELFAGLGRPGEKAPAPTKG